MTLAEHDKGKCTCGTVVHVLIAEPPEASRVYDEHGHPHLCPNAHELHVRRLAR